MSAFRITILVLLSLTVGLMFYAFVVLLPARQDQYQMYQTQLKINEYEKRQLEHEARMARLGADVLFGYNECQLKNSARITMLQLAALIQKNPETYFVIEGHTDSTGTAAYNALLGLQRAAAVRAWLVGNGVPVEHVYIRSCGSSMPLAATNGTREQQALNRRVEIHMRAGGEELPAGACDYKYKVDLTTKITHQLAAGVKVPVTPSFRLPVGASREQRAAAEQERQKKNKHGR